MDTNEPSAQHAAEVLVDGGYKALRAGDRRRARHYFTTAIASDPACAAAWEGLAALTADPHTALEYLHQARVLLSMQPGGDASVRQAIQRVQGQIQQMESARGAPSRTLPNLTPARLEPYPSRWRWVLVGLILLVLMAVIVVVALNLAPVISARGLLSRGSSGSSPGLQWSGTHLAVPGTASLVEAGQAALAAEDWPRALALLRTAHEAEPGHPAITALLYQDYLDWGRWHAAHGRYAAALLCFDRAQALAPDNLDPAVARRQVAALCRGRYAMLREDWAGASAALAPIYATDPAHPHLAAWLYQAYYERGRELEQQGQWSWAQAAYTSALKIRPQGRDAQQGLARVQKALATGPSAAPATSSGSTEPATAGRWIDIDLSGQTLTAYQGSTPVLQALVSTGTSRYPTPTGRFAIQRKYRSTHMSGPGYSLPNVPYAMFFYRGYAIHGTYWHSNFGTPMSHGCINMRTDQAGWLFDWAPVGTLVVIHN